MDELEEEKEEQEDKGAFALDAGDSLYSVDFLEEVEEKESKRFSRTDSHASKRRVSRRKGRMNTNTSCADLFFFVEVAPNSLCFVYRARKRRRRIFISSREPFVVICSGRERSERMFSTD